jgi:sugar O-acyltransferase (sialic acid O-acetyltransferase NeuD family)
MKVPLILIGGGGHCSSVIDVVEQTQKFDIRGIVDVEAKLGQEVLGYPISYTDKHLSQLVEEGCSFLLTLGQITSPQIRMRLAQEVGALGGTWATVISPRAYVSKHAKINAGTVVMHDAFINASASIGQHCIINTKALIEHDAVIKDFCHISTGSIINGGVVVGRGTFFGSGAVSKEYVDCPPESFIRAGQLFKGVEA